MQEKPFFNEAGHKIVMQIIVNLVAYTVPRSLVLFDEPDGHPSVLEGIISDKCVAFV
jgi:hypothetical protein